MISADYIRDALACGDSCCSRLGNVHCPAHKDRTPSLSVNERGGRVLVYCFAGCSQSAVIDALRQRGLW